MLWKEPFTTSALFDDVGPSSGGGGGGVFGGGGNSEDANTWSNAFNDFGNYFFKLKLLIYYLLLNFVLMAPIYCFFIGFSSN